MEVSVRNLRASYQHVVALHDLSLDIHDGELLVLLGPSGCGKTTTMRSIVGLETPDSGVIQLGDKVVFDAARGLNVPVNHRHIGMVFQSYAIWPHMTVMQNVSFPLRMQKRPKSDIGRRVKEVLSLVGMEGFEKQSASRLSGGQMQRVALARSIVMEPPVLLLDEPLSNLDAKLRERLRFELRELQQRLKMTTVYVTHDQTEAFALADRIAIMREGEIVQMGAPAELYRTPNSVFSAEFMGIDNILRAKVCGADDLGTVVALEEGGLQLTATTRLAVGTETSVCFRSEDVTLLGSAPADGRNILAGTVSSASFLGDRTRYHVHLDAGPDIYMSAADKSPAFGVGESLYIHLPTDSVTLLDT